MGERKSRDPLAHPGDPASGFRWGRPRGGDNRVQVNRPAGEGLSGDPLAGGPEKQACMDLPPPSGEAAGRRVGICWDR